LRLDAVDPSIRSQAKAQVAGQLLHSARKLVPRDVHVISHAARHHFNIGPHRSFSNVTIAEARVVQRGSRKEQQHIDCNGLSSG
jgi:hypothetical protein